MADEIKVHNIPMYLNLSEFGSIRDWSSVAGWADVSTDTETGAYKIEIRLDEESSKRLGDMVEVFDLRAIGFAGIKRRPVEQES